MVDDRNITQKRNYKNFISENKKSIYISLAIIITIITVGFIYIFSVKSEVESWQSKIYPNVTVHGVDIGGLTKEEANLKLKEGLSSPIMDKILKVVVDDKEIDLKYSEVNPVYDVESITNEAFSLGKEGSLFEKKKLISKGINKEIDAKITYDENELKKF